MQICEEPAKLHESSAFAALLNQLHEQPEP